MVLRTLSEKSMDNKYKKERKEVAHFMKRLYDKGLTTSLGGNISMRINDDVILITPSSSDKARIKWHQVCAMTIDGKNIIPELAPSMETGMHLSIYRKQMPINAIIHAHPVCASSFTAMNISIDTTLTAEAAALLGKPHMTEYALMGTPRLAEVVSDGINVSEILLLQNHGILTAGKSLLHAFEKIEALENAAKMTIITHLMGSKNPLSKNNLEEIDNMKNLYRTVML